MHLLHRIGLVGLAGLLATTPVLGQKTDDQILPKSVELLKQGEAHLAAGRFMEADDALETALAVDPRNRRAFVVMAQVAQKQKLYGQAIRFTNKALALEPADRDAIEIQGEAMVELGAIARAKANLTKLQKLCPNGCQQLSSLSSAINRGPTMAAAKPPQTRKSN